MTTLPIVDKRSFHVFEEEGEFFLFDRNTGQLVVIDVTTYAIFALIETGLSSDAAIACSTDSEEYLESFYRQVEQMFEKGFFQYIPVNLNEQKRLVKRLLRHKRRRLQLLAAQGCNLGCRYCYAWRNGSNQKSTLMDVPTGKKAIDFLISQSAHRKDLNVTFFGGEALLNLPLLFEVVSYARSRGNETGKRFHFDITTNGTLLTPEICDFLVRENFRVMVSIDGWEEMHNFNRPALDKTNSYQTIVKNALYLNNLYKQNGREPIKIRANLTEKHHDHFKTGRFLRELGFERVSVSVIEHLPHSDQSPGHVTEDSLDILQQTNLKQLKNNLNRLGNGLPLDRYDEMQLKNYVGLSAPDKLKGITCGTGRNTQTIDNKGNIYPCHRYEGMENYIIGNLDFGIDKKALLNYYTKINENATNRCHSCWVRDYCQGGCAWLLSAKDGHIADPTPRECDRRRRGFEISLWTRRKLRMVKPEFLAAPTETSCGNS